MALDLIVRNVRLADATADQPLTDIGVKDGRIAALAPGLQSDAAQEVQGGGRLVCYQLSDNSFADVPDATFDFFWSFGVLCHNNAEHIREIFRNVLPKIKPGAHAAHEIGAWDKLDQLGWGLRWGVPARFKTLPDDAIWWPRNSAEETCKIALEEGWQVIERDLGVLRRDSLCVLRKPA